VPSEFSGYEIFFKDDSEVDPIHDEVLIYRVQDDNTRALASENLAKKLPKDEPIKMRGQHLIVVYRRISPSAKVPLRIWMRKILNCLPS